MGELPNKLLEQALKLPAEERAALADSLLRSLEPPMDPDIDAAWRAEVARRVAELDAGASTIPWEQARAEILRG
jgi:putative addiction module component (TIGR02574 family)